MDMSLSELKKEAKAGFKPPVYLFVSEDYHLLREAFVLVRGSVPEGARDFSFLSFDPQSDESFSVERVLDALMTVPFIGGRMVVAVENVQKIKSNALKKLLDYTSAPCPESLLALFCKKRDYRDEPAKFKGVRTVRLSLSEKELPAWIKALAAEKGMEISGEAVEFLQATIGSEPGLLASEVKKLSLIGKKKIETNDISRLVSGEGDYTAISLAQAIAGKNADAAMKAYRALSGGVEAELLLGAINWAFLRDAKSPPEVFELLSEADVKLKTSGRTYPLEGLIVRLLRV